MNPDMTDVTVGYAIPADPASRLFPGATAGSAQLALASTNADVPLLRNNQSVKELRYTYHTAYPVSGALIGLLLLLLLAGLLVLYVLAHARFPAGAEVVVDGGTSVSLRPRSERSFMQRFLSPGALRVGAIPAEVDVPGVDSTVALPFATERRGGPLRRAHRVLHPQHQAMSDTSSASPDTYDAAPADTTDAVQFADRPLTRPRPLSDGDDFTINGTVLRYTGGHGGRDDSGSGYGGGNDGAGDGYRQDTNNHDSPSRGGRGSWAGCAVGGSPAQAAMTRIPCSVWSA